MHIGIDIGGTNLKYGIISPEGEIMFKKSIKTRAGSGPKAMISRLTKLIDELKEKYGSVLSVGLGVPGVVDPKGNVVIAPNLKGWKDIPILRKLKESIDLPISIDNDANVAAYAELKIGAGKDSSHFFYITLGTGVGGAIVADKKLFRGAGGGAGEIGHTIIDYNIDFGTGMSFFRTGILEEYTGKDQIVRLAEKLLKKYPDSILHDYGKIDSRNISIAAERQDKAALECLSTVGELLGIGLTSVLNLLDIHLVVVGGGISYSDPIMLRTAEKTIKRRALPTVSGHVEIKLAEFQNDAGIIGAALLSKDNM